MNKSRKILVALLIATLVLVGLGFPSQSAQATTKGKLVSYWGYPTFSIVSVEQDETVTIKTYNLPANDTFDVGFYKVGDGRQMSEFKFSNDYYELIFYITPLKDN